MPRTIHVLPDRVANQIAAGEVVERPASVVKELVENALDAHARRIEIEVARGGKRRIRVVDDGSGMGRDDALLSLDRHATSKIREANDLPGVRTFGFRGEALPSIAAVSRLIIETRDEASEVGTRVRVSGGSITGIDDTPRQRGTTVEVSSLFFNAPARSKFMKAVGAETRAISDVVTRLALANPGIFFTLSSDGRVLLDLPPAAELSTRIGQLWGTDAARTLLSVRGGDASIHVRGLAQRPDAARPGTRRAQLFINGRPFRDQRLIKAVDRGYRTTIADKINPWVFLYIETPGGGVDVNVHPAKAEVRFKDHAGVEDLIEWSVRDSLAGESSGATFDKQLIGPTPVVREVPPKRPERVDTQVALFVSEEASPAASMTSDGEPEQGVRLFEERPRLWQVHDTYVLAETREGLLIIDQHSAHERILFEELMEAFERGGQESQRLLFPLTLRLQPAEFEQVEALAGILERVGFDVEGFGGNTVIVQGVPAPHPYFDAERCFREMVEELTHGSELVRSARNQHEKIAMTFACKGAIKAGQKLATREMEVLFDRLFGTELPFHDVHGRPTIVRLSTGELERKFGR
jgi:DNA mismatch repair protein MutL